MAGGVIMKIAYGYDVKDEQDEFVELIERANVNFSKSTVPGAFIVDVFPLLKYLPEWAPGAGFLSLAREWRQLTDANADLPFEFTKNQRVRYLFVLLQKVSEILSRTPASPEPLWFQLGCKNSRIQQPNIPMS